MDAKKALTIINTLKKAYPDAKCGLDYQTPYELAVATILSAQCTDKRVNIVTEKLFKAANSPEAIVSMGFENLKGAIFQCGLSNTKAKNIIAMSETLLVKYGGELPKDKSELVKLPGIGQKTANVIISNAFGQDAIAVDTHVFRVSNRLGLAHSKNVLATEKDLCQILPKEEWSLAHHLIIRHGRDICHARNPQCASCPISIYCESDLAQRASE